MSVGVFVASNGNSPALILKHDVEALRHQVILVSVESISDTDLPLLFCILLQLCRCEDARCLDRSQPLKLDHIGGLKLAEPTLSPVVGPHCPLLQYSPGGGADQRLLIFSLLNHSCFFVLFVIIKSNYMHK